MLAAFCFPRQLDMVGEPGGKLSPGCQRIPVRGEPKVAWCGLIFQATWAKPGEGAGFLRKAGGNPSSDGELWQRHPGVSPTQEEEIPPRTVGPRWAGGAPPHSKELCNSGVRGCFPGCG